MIGTWISYPLKQDTVLWKISREAGSVVLNEIWKVPLDQSGAINFTRDQRSLKMFFRQYLVNGYFCGNNIDYHVYNQGPRATLLTDHKILYTCSIYWSISTIFITISTYKHYRVDAQLQELPTNTSMREKWLRIQNIMFICFQSLNVKSNTNYSTYF